MLYLFLLNRDYYVYLWGILREQHEAVSFWCVWAV